MKDLKSRQNSQIGTVRSVRCLFRIYFHKFQCDFTGRIHALGGDVLIGTVISVAAGSQVGDREAP